jgi:3'-5' exoribonuclease
MTHDIGKIKEMEISELGLVTDYSTEGILLGHIVQGIKIIDNICDELGTDSEIKIMLEHMILSHHYEPEYGSPKYPMFPEAEVLSICDLLDSKMYEMDAALDGVSKDGFSERQWALDNRQLFKID